MLNPFQRLCADRYADGDFAHIENLAQAREAGDTLFTFLMIELASSEDCDSQAEALRRLDQAIANIEDVASAVRASDPPPPR